MLKANALRCAVGMGLGVAVLAAGSVGCRSDGKVSEANSAGVTTGRVNVKNSALHMAARGNNVAEIRRLVASGVPVDFRGRENRTALQEAAADDSYQAVVTLLELGADPKIADHLGETALMKAANRGLPAICEALIAKGSPVNAANRSGMTALHYAAREYRADIVRMLVAAGADPQKRNARGQTPLELAKFNPAISTALGIPPVPVTPPTVAPAK